MRGFIFRDWITSCLLAAGIVLVAMAFSEPAWPGEAAQKGDLERFNVQLRPSPPSSRCAATQDIRDKLLKRYNETQRSIGLAKGGKSVLEIYTSPEGSWTAVITTPDSVTCFVAAGELWMDVKQPEPGMGM